MTAPKTLNDGWLAAWQEAMRQNAEAHTAFQQAMAQARRENPGELLTS